MKNNLIIVSLVLYSFILNAQVSKGAFYLGGGFSSSTQVTSGNRTIFTTPTQTQSTPIEGTSSNIEFKIGTGYLIGNRLSLGLNLGVSSIRNKEKILAQGYNSSYDIEKETNIFFISPLIRYFIMIEDNFGITVSFDTRYQRGRGNEKNYNYLPYNNSNYFGISGGFSPGIIFFPSSKFGLEANLGFLGYSYTKEKKEFPTNNFFSGTTKTVDDVTKTGAGFNVDTFRSLFNLGMNIYLGGE